MTAYSISRQLNRSPGAIYKRLSNMNIILTPRWTTEEVEFVKTHYQSAGVIYCSQKLGRTPDAIQSYTSIHKLFRETDET